MIITSSNSGRRGQGDEVKKSVEEAVQLQREVEVR
jgi:hypothetical protein